MEAFALVIKMNIIQVLHALVTPFGRDLHQLDMKNAFLHGALEKVYMEIPLRFETHSGRSNLCLLEKALYDLKKSSRVWFGRFTKAMVCSEYKQSQGDNTLFIKHCLQENLV